MPEVSVVMPVRNAQSTVDAAVRSVVAQTLPDWELIAIDDGSTDHTPDILRGWAARDPRVRVHVDGSGAGLPARLNQGVLLATGALVARMDGDDVMYPQRLAKQVGYLREHPDVDLVGGGAMVFAGAGVPRGARCFDSEHAALTANVLRGIRLIHPTWTGRRDWFAAHRYEVRARSCEDQELLLRAYPTSRYASLPDLVLGYREDRIKLRRTLQARLHHSGYVLRHGVHHAALPAAVGAVAVQAAAGARDTLAVLTRRPELVLDRRNRPPTPAQIAEWNAVWRSVTDAEEATVQ
jgi:glycosyltransferase involved in cell wall biosynthesis